MAPPPPSTITLTASGYKVKGVQHATLAWTNAISIYVFSDGQQIAIATGTTYDDFIGKKGVARDVSAGGTSSPALSRAAARIACT